MNNKEKLWNPRDKELWTNQWEKSSYSLKDKIEANRWNSIKYSKILPTILDRIKKNDKIVEAGCGMGQWVVYLSDLGYDITGVDYSESTINNLNSNLPNYQWDVEDITDFGYDNERFNVMLSWGVVEHFEAGPQIALAEANRVIKENGLLFITVPCKEGLYLFLDPILWIKRFLIKNPLIRRLRGKNTNWFFFEHYFRKKEFEEHIMNANFELVDTIPISHESGLIRPLSELIRISQNSRNFLEGIIYKNKMIGRRKQYDGLTRFGRFLVDVFYKISPWVTPSQMLVIARKAGSTK